VFTDLRQYDSLIGAIEAATFGALDPFGAQTEQPGIHLYDLDGSCRFHTYGEILTNARRAATFLRSRGVGPGTPVVIALPTGLDFLHLFFGTMFAGGIPVPLAPPVVFGDYRHFFARGERIYARLGDSAHWVGDAVTHAALLEVAEDRRPPLANTWPMESLYADWDDLVPIRGERLHETALIQFTSGSTSEPRGVVLSHRNLLANIEAIRRGTMATPDDVVVSWLPLYHDMGLIGGLLFPMIANLVLALMSPIRFIMDPLTWLQAMHDHEGTMSPAPNFGYELVTRRSRRRDDELERLDLSRWRVALTGAEHVRPESMARFTARFGRCGFRRAAFLPVYGLAESSLAVSFSDPHRAARAVTISRRAVLRDGVARRHYPSSPPEDAWRVVSVGQPVWSSDVRIVTARGDRVRMGWVGQIQVRGPSVTSGYYNDPESTAAILNDGWLTTGDLGFQLVLPGDRHPSLFIVDRLKGLIVKRGRNLYAADIEQLVWEVPGIKAGVAAFGVLGEGRRGAEEMLIVVAEVAEPNNPDECARVEREVQESVSTSTGILIDQLVQVPRRTLPRTTSGKIQRIVAKTRWADGEYR